MSSFFTASDIKVDCSPIKLLDELKSWTSHNSKKYYTHSLQKRSNVKDSPKTLVCHDMKGGYLEDRFIYGSESEDNYYFIHWSMVDVFIYFSHHLVTIPPCGWISSAHRNGVKVLGTFITEWDAGKEICENILCDKESVHQICLQLVKIADFYEFDGWLLNIENKINAKQVLFLEEFVKFLTLKMHENNPDSLVIWYDSVIQSGELKWQNELNEHNRNFFDMCDGIFLNYNWKQDNLKKSVEEAGARKTDVFVGVDVFGRGCLGDGGFCTNIAVTAARDYNLSVAIFAPGWVHECLDCKDFTENQYKFWNSLIELCPIREVESLPYYSSFCPGFGKNMFRNGKIQSSKPWYNLSLQQPQPSYHYTQCPSKDSMMYIYCADAFNGGGCLQLKSLAPENCSSIEFKILSTNFCINTDCYISYTFKCMDENVKVSLIVDIYNGDKYCLNLLEASKDLLITNSCKEEECNLCPNCVTLSNPKLLPVSTKAVMSSVANVPWIKRKYKLYCHANESYFINSVGIRLSREKISTSEVSILLGELMISPLSNRIQFSYKDLNVLSKDEFNMMLECYLEWSSDARIDYCDLYVLVDGAKHYICTTSQFCFSFKGSVKNTHGIEFILCPKIFGKTSQSVLLKVLFNSDKNSVNHLMVE